MEVFYKNKHLQRCAEDGKYSVRNLGPVRSEKYIRRVGDLCDAETLEEVRNLPGHYHELTGDRKGQWAVSLDGPYRLIFEPHEKPIPIDEDGKYIWVEIKGVELLEINNYHGK